MHQVDDWLDRPLAKNTDPIGPRKELAGVLMVGDNNVVHTLYHTGDSVAPVPHPLAAGGTPPNFQHFPPFESDEKLPSFPSYRPLGPMWGRDGEYNLYAL